MTLTLMFRMGQVQMKIERAFSASYLMAIVKLAQSVTHLQDTQQSVYGWP